LPLKGSPAWYSIRRNDERCTGVVARVNVDIGHGNSALIRKEGRLTGDKVSCSGNKDIYPYSFARRS
jgi:hypothetical protein